MSRDRHGNVPAYHRVPDHKHIPQGQVEKHELRNEWNGSATGVCPRSRTREHHLSPVLRLSRFVGLTRNSLGRRVHRHNWVEMVVLHYGYRQLLLVHRLNLVPS